MRNSEYLSIRSEGMCPGHQPPRTYLRIRRLRLAKLAVIRSCRSDDDPRPQVRQPQVINSPAGRCRTWPFLVMDSLPEDARGGPAAVLSRFRREFHACLTARRDEMFELADAVLCADGPVRDLAGLSLAPEHRRGHGALYDAVNHGRIDVARLRRSLAGLPLPRAARWAADAGGGCEQLAAARARRPARAGCSAMSMGGARARRR